MNALSAVHELNPSFHTRVVVFQSEHQLAVVLMILAGMVEWANADPLR